MSDNAKLDGAIIAEEDDGIRLDRWFKRHREGTPHALLARWARSGQLTLDGKKADVSDRIATWQKLVMPPPPVETVARPRCPCRADGRAWAASGHRI